jgi:hypothetical protein
VIEEESDIGEVWRQVIEAVGGRKT